MAVACLPLGVLSLLNDLRLQVHHAVHLITVFLYSITFHWLTVILCYVLTDKVESVTYLYVFQYL
jgi:hypothetical protein